MGWYLGIDESNHNQFPESIVGVLTDNPELARARQLDWGEKILGKKHKIKDNFHDRRLMERIEAPRTLEGITSDYIVRHMIISRHQIEDSLTLYGVGYPLIKGTAIIQMIQEFGNPEEVVIDGELVLPVLEYVQKVSEPRSRVYSIADADHLYPHVNKADEAAYFLITKRRNMGAKKFYYAYSRAHISLDSSVLADLAHDPGVLAWRRDPADWMQTF